MNGLLVRVGNRFHGWRLDCPDGHDREPVGRHLVGRADGARPEAGRVLPRHRGRAMAGPLHGPLAVHFGALQLRVAGGHSRPAAAPAGWRDGRELLRSQSGDGLVDGEQALLDIARDIGVAHDEPQTREDWARLMRRVGVKGIQIAERDTQRARRPKPLENSSTHGRSRASSPKVCSHPSSAGARTRRRCPPAAGITIRPRRGDLPDAAGRRHARALVDADRAGRSTAG